MTFEEAKELLNQCTRSELRDHAFGDREIYFTLCGKDVAEGYSGGGSSNVTIFGSDPDGSDASFFEGSEGRELLECGTLGEVERNDSTGPDEFEEGECMPGLTLEGVKDELTTDAGISVDLEIRGGGEGVDPEIFKEPIQSSYLGDEVLSGRVLFNKHFPIDAGEYINRKRELYRQAKKRGEQLIIRLTIREYDNLSLRKKVERKRWIAYVESL